MTDADIGCPFFKKINMQLPLLPHLNSVHSLVSLCCRLESEPPLTDSDSRQKKIIAYLLFSHIAFDPFCLF